ncbi:MAG TPA: alpha/beta fold hydrolase, partial [Polyangiaceae bacterium]|nr:alpha/beta fold hydrolase [Polyangiaceae bacterium]
MEFQDPTVGPVRLTGEWLEHEGDELLVVVHGLGGNSQSVYMGLALQAAERAGISCLLLNLRGADRSGVDIHHAGLVEDLEAVLGSPLLAHYRRLYVFGYSLGGHLTFRYGARP